MEADAKSIDQAASALDRRYLAGMERLIELVQELSFARDLPTIQRVVLATARELTQADGAAFVLRVGNDCYYADENAIGPLWKGQRFPMDHCISGWSMRNGKPAVIEDVYQDERIPIEAYRPTFVKSLAIVPIRTRDPVGAIASLWAKQHRASAREMRLLQALADSTAAAMENVKVYQELEQRVEARTAELRAANEEIRNLSLTDELTGLRNRRGFFLFAEQARRLADRAGKKAAIVYADLDGLKAVNDRYGHVAGDTLLRDFAHVLTTTFRESDVVARVGGDEFCVFGAELDIDTDALLSRLEYNIARFNAEQPRPFPLAASAGVWRCPFKGEEPLEDLVARADEAMYLRKRARRHAG
jgi:diguanylate cyclase (GGDEF)-like protein